MRLLEALFQAGILGGAPLPAGRGLVVGFVGGGGKTASLFALAGELAGRGDRVLLGTTTHIRDPRREVGRRFEAFVLEPGLGGPPGPDAGRVAAELRLALERALAEGLSRQGAPDPGAPLRGATDPAAEGGRRGAVLVAGPALVAPGPSAGSGPEAPRLGAIRPEWAAVLAGAFDAVLLECDGSRGLPIKAPAAHEPVLPEAPDLLLGLLGLDALGLPIQEGMVHRPELLAGLLGKKPGGRVLAEDLARLALEPMGLFKASNPGAKRVLVLNKADLLGEAAAREAFAELLACLGAEDLACREAGPASGAPDLVLLAETGAARPERRVLALAAPTRARSPASPAAR